MRRWAMVFLGVLAACDDEAATRVTNSLRHENGVVVASPGGADVFGGTDVPGDVSGDVSGSDTTLEPDDTHQESDAETPLDDTSSTNDIGTPTDTVTDPTDVTTPSSEAPPPVPPLTAQQLTTVRAAFDGALAAGLSTATFGGLVVDLENGQTLWEKSPDRVLIPASNSKVLTTAAAIDLLGPDHRMVTKVLSTATIDGAGNLGGDLAIHSGHDFTLSPWFHNNPRTPLERLADRLWQRGLRRVSGQLVLAGAWLYNGYHLGTYDPATHRERVITNFRAALTERGITVVGANRVDVAMAEPAGTELARWTSNPLHVAAFPINRISHNEMADALARHLGWIRRGTSDYATSGAVIRDWLATTGVDTTGFVVNDGSGLATTSRVSPRQLVGVYRYMITTDRWSLFKSTLSVGGGRGPSATDGSGTAILTTLTAPYNGTLANRMTGDDTAGRVFGKSGTNAGITTSGVVFNRHDGRRYAFAFMMNDIAQSSYSAARATQDNLIAVIGRDHRQRGARPAAPTLGCVLGRADGHVEIHLAPQPALAPAAGSAGFRVQISEDGERWGHPDQDGLFVLQSPVVVPADKLIFVRAFAENTAGRSDASDVYAVRPPRLGRPNDARVLLVDANDRWQRQPVAENTLGVGHTFMRDWALALPDELAFDTCPDEAVASGSGLAAWDAVMWAAAEDAATDESIAAVEATKLVEYLELGGSLFVSGAEVSWDLDPAGNTAATAADKAFLNAWLKTAHQFDSARANAVEGVAGGLFADLTHEHRVSFWTPGLIFVGWPDVIQPLGGARTCLNYAGLTLGACVQYQGDYDLVHLAFPFESIDGAAERALVMGRILDFFGL